MRVIIKDNQIIFIARYANNRRNPYITMYLIKIIIHTRIRTDKR
jgi:hypothetical protein